MKSKEKLRRILEKNARLFGLKLIDKKVDRYFMKEDFHIFTLIENEIFRWELQITIDVAKVGLIHSMIFLHPIVITEQTKPAYIEFANEANMFLVSEMGRFWVNDDNDYCYECYIPNFLLEYEKELETQLFDKPFAHFRDCLTPLMMMREGEWGSAKSIEYLGKLRRDGYVDNIEYGLEK